MIKDAEKRRWKLQLFAGDEGGEGGNPGDGGGAGGEGGGDEGNEPLTFDDFLKQEGNQAEFDRRVQKAMQTAVKNARDKWELETNDKLTEAEKLARMTKEQKAEYKAKQLEAELDEMKKEKALAEMSKTARKMLSEEKINIPDELLCYMVSEDAEATKEAVEAFVKLFNEVVGEELKKSARQDTPPEGGGSSLGGISKADMKEMAKKARIIK